MLVCLCLQLVAAFALESKGPWNKRSALEHAASCPRRSARHPVKCPRPFFMKPLDRCPHPHPCPPYCCHPSRQINTPRPSHCQEPVPVLCGDDSAFCCSLETTPGDRNDPRQQKFLDCSGSLNTRPLIDSNATLHRKRATRVHSALMEAPTHRSRP